MACLSFCLLVCFIGLLSCDIDSVVFVNMYQSPCEEENDDDDNEMVLLLLLLLPSSEVSSL